MSLIALTSIFHVSGEMTAEELDTHVDALADALYDLEESVPELLDSAVGADLGKRIVEVSVTVEGDTLDDGVTCADSCVRTAIHAAGGATPNWGTRLERTRSEAELVPA